MTSIPYWGDDEKAWNSVPLGDVVVPGICSVVADKGRNVEIKKTKGQDGHTMTDNGTTVGKVTITTTIVNREQWQLWQAVRERIDPVKQGGARTPLEIQHPEAQDRGIQNVYVKHIKGAPPTARGAKTFVIECEEWFPQPKPTKATTSKAKSVNVNYQEHPNHVVREMSKRVYDPIADPYAPTGADALDKIYSSL